MNPSTQLIILTALESAPYLPAHAIADLLNLSDKTTRSLLNTLNEVLSDVGASIHVKKHYGYSLQIHDKQSYAQFKESLENKPKPTQQNTITENRVLYLIDLLLRNQDPIRIDDIATTLFVSRSSIQNDLKHVRTFLASFDLEIQSKPYNGIYIEGAEFMIRNALVSYYTLRTQHNQFQDYFDHPLYKTIHNTLHEMSNRGALNVSAIAFQDILLHLFIAYQRNLTQNVIPLSDSLYPYTIHTLFSKLSKKTSIDISDTEKQFYTALINSRQTITLDTTDSNEIAQHTRRITHSLKSLRDYYDVDFLMGHAYDQTLINNLTLQFMTLMQRVQLNSQLRNPYKNHIQRHYLLSFHMAKLFCRIIDNDWQHKISDDEISFCAPFFETALTQRILSSNMKHVTYLLDGDTSFQQLQKNQYLTHFPHHIRNFNVISSLDLDHYDFKSTDILISTQTIPKSIPVPSIQVPLTLESSDRENINTLLRKTKINFKKPQLPKENFNVYTPSYSLSDIISTEGNRIASQTHQSLDSLLTHLHNPESYHDAFIHNRVLVIIPLQTNAHQTTTTLSILKKPFTYDSHSIKLVCVIYNEGSFNRNLMRYYEILSEIFSNTMSVNEIIESQSHECFMKYYSRLESQLLLK